MLAQLCSIVILEKIFCAKSLSNMSQSKNPRACLIGADSRGLRYLVAHVCSVVTLEKMFEHVVDETSDDAYHDFFYYVTYFIQNYRPLP